MTPATGGAWLVYLFSSTSNTVTGGFNSVLPTAYGSYLPWTSTNGQLEEDSSSTDAKVAAEAFKKFCLLTKPDNKTWPDIMGTVDDAANAYFSKPPIATKDMRNIHQTLWKSAQGENRFCVNQVRTIFFRTFSFLFCINQVWWTLSQVVFGVLCSCNNANVCDTHSLFASTICKARTCTSFQRQSLRPRSRKVTRKRAFMTMRSASLSLSLLGGR
jgi:hypothetical protein